MLELLSNSDSFQTWKEKLNNLFIKVGSLVGGEYPLPEQTNKKSHLLSTNGVEPYWDQSTGIFVGQWIFLRQKKYSKWLYAA